MAQRSFSCSRFRATAWANISPTSVNLAIKSSGQGRVSRKAAKATAPIMRPPIRKGILRCECSPVRLKYSASPTASGGRSSAGFCTASISPARSLATNQPSCAGRGPSGVASTPSTAVEDRTTSEPSSWNSAKVQRSNPRNFRSIACTTRISNSTLSAGTLANRAERSASMRSNARSSSVEASLFGAVSAFADLLNGIASGMASPLRARSRKIRFDLTALISERL